VADHSFSLGEQVAYQPHSGAAAATGAYTVVRLLPEDQFGEVQYGIWSEREGHERIAREGQLRPMSGADTPDPEPEEQAPEPASGGPPNADLAAGGELLAGAHVTRSPVGPSRGSPPRSTPEEARQRAAARAERVEQQQREAAEAWAEQRKGATDLRDRTERLRSLRLAHEAEGVATPGAKPAAKPGARSGAKSVAKAGAKSGAEATRTKPKRVPAQRSRGA
jgi:hypothetical protein